MTTMDQQDRARFLQTLEEDAQFRNDVRNSGRAARNPGFLTKMTGHPTHSMVASVSNDHAVQELVKAGNLHWLQFDQKEFDPD